MKRSLSSSHIPILKTEPSGRKRSHSASRSSVEPKVSINRYMTPVNRPHRPFYGSSASGAGTSTSSRKVQRTGSGVKGKTIQALCTDKRWCQDQFVKVKTFMCESGLFDVAILDQLKPPNINTFVHVTNVLLDQILPSNNTELTQQNYKELLPNKLKLLNYPGTVSNSLLKTVNTMHVWPQVIGMFGWLVDKCELKTNVPMMVVGKDAQFLRSKTAKRSFQSFVDAYNAFNMEPEAMPMVVDEYAKKIKDAFRLDEAKLLIHQKTVKEETKTINHMKKEIEEHRNMIHEIESKTKELHDEIEDLQNLNNSSEESSDQKLIQIESDIESTDRTIDEISKRIEDLEVIVEKQPYDREQKLELLERLDRISKDLEREEQKREQVERLLAEMKPKTDVEKEKLRKAVFEWNNHLTKFTILKPELKPLLLDEKKLHDVMGFLEETEDWLKRKNAHLEMFAVKAKDEENELKEMLISKGKLQSDIRNMEDTLDLKEKKLMREEEEKLALIDEYNEGVAKLKMSAANLEELMYKLQLNYVETLEDSNDIRQKILDAREQMSVMVLENLKKIQKLHAQVRISELERLRQKKETLKMLMEQQKENEEFAIECLRKVKGAADI